MNSIRFISLMAVVAGVLVAHAAAPATDSLKLIPPWTAVTAKTSKAGVEVGVWGRTQKFTNALPSSIVTAGGEILAAPIRLVGQVSGKPIEWKRGGSFLFNTDKSVAVVSGWQAGDDLIVDTTTRVEFDGVMRVDLVVLPQRKVAPKVERLWLEVPLKRSRASLYHYWPGSWGGAKNSGALPEAGLTLAFKPFVWLGWEDGGLGWFTESDKGWQPQDPKQPIEVVVSGDQTVLRLHLLDSPPPRLPVTYTLGFQATPVKPWVKNFHEWRVWHGGAYGIESTLWKADAKKPDYGETYLAGKDSTPSKSNAKKTLLDRAAELGVKTIVFHEHWTPYQNYPVTTQEAELKKLVTACHRRGIKLLPYYGYEFSSLAPEWGEMSDEVLVKTTAGGYTGGYYRGPDQRDYIVCYNSRWRDILLRGIERSLTRYGYDGVYLDGTTEPWACANEKHGCGYRGTNGVLHATYPIFAVRKLMHGLAAAIHPRGGLVNPHQSTCCVMPTLAYADSYWDGEQFEGGQLSTNAIQQLPLAAFRAEFMGRNYGVPAEFLVYERPPQWTFDHALAFTMLHNVRVRPGGGLAALEKMAPIWNVMTRFGVSRAEWHPYWETNPLVTTASLIRSIKIHLSARHTKQYQVHTLPTDTVKTSFYLAGKAPSRRALLVVSNLSLKDQPSASLSLDLKRLGLRETGVKAKDALTGQSLALQAGRLSVPLPPMRMRMVWIE
ncbi:MAG: hypothetical protein WCV00_07890 [Verrucomicrobiia bacterium]